MIDGSSADGAHRLRAVATSLLGDVSSLADDMLEFLAAHIPAIGADPELRGLTLGSCSSNLEAALSMIRHGIDVAAAEAPVTALEHARAMASRGHSVDVMLRFYRLGHRYFVETFAEAVSAQVDDPAQSLAAFLEMERFGFRYIDRISTLVASEYVAELDRRQNQHRAERDDIVRALLVDERINVGRAERVLGHTLTGRQLGFVCWAAGNIPDLVAVAQRFAKSIASERALVVADGPRAVWGWVTTAEPSALCVAKLVRSYRPDEKVHLAVGSLREGPAGFRVSHREALRARRIAELAGWPAASVTEYGDIALVDVMSSDLDAARAFVEAELGDLARDDPRSRDERTALSAFFSAQGSLKVAAATLGIHRNTVLQRVRRAEQRLGQPIRTRVPELHAALRVYDVLGAPASQNLL